MKKTNHKATRIRFVSISILSILILGISAIALKNTKTVFAADNDFSDNVITVDSTGDGSDTDINDSICDDGSGNCTLRAAIEESNDEAGIQTIEFSITGTADFTNNTQNGYTIKPGTALPSLTDTVIIDGYSQPGALANTAVAPNPLNGTLLIEIDGTNAGVSQNGLNNSANDSEIRGLVINRFTNGCINIDGDDVKIYGNYCGTDPTGTIDQGNLNGVGSGPSSGDNVSIGGSLPGQRNVISGNDDGALSINIDHDGWIVRGNYIGVAADGITGLGNGGVGGNPSIDDVVDTIVGGPNPADANVISDNNGHGIAPFNAQRTIIQGNFIGVGYDGTTALGNGAEGITFGGGSIDVQVISNVIANNGNNGVGFYQSSNGGIVDGNTITNNSQYGVSFDTSNNGTVTNNTISENTQGGVNIGNVSDNAIVQNNTITNNNGQGVAIFNSSSTLVGGTSSQGNQLSGNTQAGVAVYTFSGVSDGNTVQGNIIEDSLFGVAIISGATNTLVGGATTDRGNTIRNNSEGGVVIARITAAIVPVSFTPTGNSILGNSIYNNALGSFNSGLGIDLAEFIDTSSPPDGIPESFNEIGITNNDSSDTDSGANDLVNFPVLSSFTQSGTTASVLYALDAADSPSNQYRVEFFANDTADPSGHGEGQTYLGAVTTAPGSDLTANFTLPNGTNLTGKQISATTTAIDNTTNSGFGSTSEFSGVVLAAVTDVPSNNPASGSQGGWPREHRR
jgi:parallel beta-helix repeat protein